MTHCRLALEALDRLNKIEVKAVSSIYETEPVCCEGPFFINGVVELSSALGPIKLLQCCHDIEAQLGRIRENRCQSGDLASSRTIDLDILLYGDQILDTTGLKVPHPRMHERGFVLIPLAEIAPKQQHPILKKCITEILAQFKNAHQVKKIAPAPVIYPHSQT